MANPRIIVEYIAETAKLVGGMQAVAKSGDTAANSVNKVNWKGIAQWTGAAIAIGAGVKFLHGASEATAELAKSTLQLQRATGMETADASAWVSLLQSRGVEVGTFQTSVTRLSKNMETWRTTGVKSQGMIKDLGAQLDYWQAKPGKDAEKQAGKIADQIEKWRGRMIKARGALGELGVKQQDITKGNVQGVLLQVADALSKVENPARRAALAQQLFGRAGQRLLPILLAGKKGIEDQLATVRKSGAVLGDKQIEQAKAVAKAQRELALAHKGVQIAIGSALLPAQVALYQSFLHIVQAVLPFVDNVQVMKGFLIAAAVAMGVYKVAMIASTVATLAATPAFAAFGAAVWASLGPIALVVAAIAALIVVGVLLYKHWDQLTALAGKAWNAIKTAAQSAFNWIKSNWPLLLPILLGPIGIAAAIIIRNWQTIRNAVVSALSAIRSAVTSAWHAIVAVVVATGNAIRAAVVAVWNAARSATTAAMNAIRAVVVSGFNAVVAAVRAAMNALVGAIRSAVGRATSAARSIATGVKAVFSGARTWLVQAGRDIVQGLVDGITSMLGKVRDAAGQLANAAKSVVTGPVGFLTHSPSRWAYAVGTDVGQGLANGIVAGTPAAEKAARDMAQRTMKAAKTSLQGLATSLSGQLAKAFQARQQAAQTPAEQALAAMQDAHDEAQRQQALADAQAQLAAATTDEERLSAQRAYNDAAYAIQIAALQRTATTERTQLDQRQADEQTAYDNSIKALQGYLNSAHATASGARTRINKLMRQYGLDFATVGNLLGTNFASGLEKSIGEVTKAAQKLAKAVHDALKAGLKIGSPSKVMVGVGYETVRGLALGITRNAGLVNNALRAVMPSGTLAASPLAQAATAAGPVNVRVFIGDQELRGLVRTEIVENDSGLARTLLAGIRQ